MHYNWKIFGRYKCPRCGWELARKKVDHAENVSICCHCKTPMEEIDPVTKKFLTPPTSVISNQIVNGKCYPLWNQIIATKDRFVDGILQDLDDGTRLAETIIVDITLKPNGVDSAYFEVVGKDFGCGFDCQYGGISSGEKGWLTFSGYGGHTWRIKERAT